MKQKMASALLTFMGLALLIYTASRTLNFLRLTLPADQHDTAYLALVAFDGGLVLWTLFYLHGARGSWQRGIAALMIVVSLVGVLIGFGADTLYVASGAGLARLSADFTQTAIWGMVIIIGLNVAAITATQMTHPDALRAQAEEEARDKIETAKIRAISNSAEQLAAELAPHQAASWTANERALQLPVPPPLPRDSDPEPVKPPGVVDQLQSGLSRLTGGGNGHVDPTPAPKKR